MSKFKKETEKLTGGVKSFFADFKKFITKGNILDLAVAVIIGGAFGKIVTSLVNDIIMPLIGLVLNKSLAELAWVIKPAYVDSAGVTIPATSLNYGAFLQNILDFLIVALCIFIVLRTVVAIQRNYANLEKRINGMLKDARAKYIRELKKQKKTKEEIEEALKEYDANQKENLAVATDAIIAATPAPKAEEILTDIKQLLAEQVELLKNQAENNKK